MMSPSLLDHTADNNSMSYPLDNPDDNSNSESDFLTSKYSNNTTPAHGKKPKRGRPPKYEPSLGMTPENSGRRNQHLSQPDSRDGYSSADDYEDNNSSELPVKAKFLEPGEVLRPPTSQKTSSRAEQRGKLKTIIIRKKIESKCQMNLLMFIFFL
jgi:hypothetical protein